MIAALPANDETAIKVVDFWRLPDDGDAYLPVVHWQRDPNAYTHRVVFPLTPQPMSGCRSCSTKLSSVFSRFLHN